MNWKKNKSDWYCFDCDKWIPKEEVINKPVPERGFNVVNSNYCKKCDCELGIFQTVTIKKCEKCGESIRTISNERGKSKEFPCPAHSQQNNDNPNNPAPRNKNESSSTPDNTRKQYLSGLPEWITFIIGSFFIILPFLLLFLVIRFLWRAGSKKSR